MTKELRILILEDNAADADLIERELRKTEFNLSFRQVATEADFIQALTDFLPDVILSDHALSNFSGPAALRLARELYPETPFIIISGIIGEEEVELLRQGATDCMSKRNLAKLGPAVERALREVESRDQKRRAESALRDSESRFRAIFEGAGAGIAVEDLQGRILETNRALQQMLGYTAEDLQAITRQDFTHARDDREDQAHYQRLVAGESDNYQVEKRFVRRDGRIIWGRLTVSMVRGAAGQPQFSLAMIEDITERQQAEETHLQYAAIIEFSNDAIICMTFDGVIFSWNPAAERVYGYTPSEANGRAISIVIPPEREAEFSQILERIKHGEHIDNFETTRVRNDGSLLHVSVTISPIKDVAGKIIGASSISRDITERKLAEAALRESEASLARAQRIAHLGSWEWDLRTQVLTWSDETYRIFGLTRGEQECSVELFFRSVHPEDREMIRQALDETLKQGNPYGLDHRIVLPKGEIRTVNEQAEVFLDEQGTPIRLLGTVLDITQRKQAENLSAAFSKLGQRLSSATTAAEAARIIAEEADKLFGWDACNLMLCSNDLQTFHTIFNVDLIAGERRAVPPSKRVMSPSPRMRAVLENGAQLILRGDSSGEPLAGHPFGDRSRPSVSAMYVPVRNGVQIIGVFSIHSYSRNAYTQNNLETLQSLGDHCGGALERIRAESENQKLAAFPQFNPNPVLELAADGAVNYFNEAAQQMAQSLGLGQIAEFLPRETPAIVKDCLATGQSKLGIQTAVHKRTIAWSFFPVQSIGVVHCYAGDITDRQNLEAQLRQAQKMESVGRLAGGIAHDFNNILTVIQGHTSLLSLSANLAEDAQESAEQIGLAAERAANLTRQLLTFSRRQIMQPRNLDLNELVNNLTKMLRRLLGEDISLQVNYASGLPLVHADPGMMEQILLNLSINARDAMPKGGSLLINTSIVAIDHASVEQSPEAVAGNFVCLTVRDTGVGIPPEVLPHIFEPFFTTKDVGKGTGLGLATVYGIVRQHRGWVKAASTLNQETVFQIFLPAANVKTSSASGPAQESRARGGKETILVVEDEPPLRALVRSVLERYGYRVLEAESGVAALAVWEAQRDEVQLLLTDMVMPHGISGQELAKRFLADKPELKVIYSSGYSLAVVGADMVLQEGLNFLQKPYHPRKLAQAIRDCLDG